MNNETSRSGRCFRYGGGEGGRNVQFVIVVCWIQVHGSLQRLFQLHYSRIENVCSCVQWWDMEGGKSGKCTQ